VVLKGAQSIGKTRWIRNICPPELSHKYYEGGLSNDKDSILKVARNFIVNLDELETTTTKAEVGSLKTLIYQTTITERVPYGHHTQQFKKYASFMGSVNQNTFLYDQTGARRFPVIDLDTKKIDQDKMRSYNINDVWAEALRLYESGELPYLTQSELDFVNETAKEYTIKSYLEEEVNDRFIIMTKQMKNEFVYRKEDGYKYVKIIIREEDDEIIMLPANFTDQRLIEVRLSILSAKQMYFILSGRESTTDSELNRFGRTLSHLNADKASERIIAFDGTRLIMKAYTALDKEVAYRAQKKLSE
jgi:predicted P-loop ATPase